ncbi:unnamed protein product [Ectocarpus sp. 8 AP-2014]
MKPGLLLRLGALAGAAKLAVAECPNACSGRGTCGAYDMCTCYSGYMANDCSERVCPFGLAHVDSPKGDLNMDNELQYRPAVIEGSQMYKDGTSELFPIMATVNGTIVDNTAHYYMECSNKGLCDRTTATCTCFAGYEGTSCQRASCPNDCSGHGVCKTNRELAADDHDNVYELWDADMSLACHCDAGYGSYDCSERMCPYGIDPLFIDDENTARIPEWTIRFEDALDVTGVEGTWRLRFNDVFGEDWVTNPIPFNTTCTDLVAELEAIPNDVIDEGTVQCLHKHDEVTPDSWTKYMLSFTGNPGVHKIPEILVLDESGRHTLKKTGADAYAGLDIAVVYDAGITGEFYDYFMQKCGVVIGVTDFATTVADNREHYGLVQTTSISSGTLRTLKECLGDSNGVSTDNVGVENWDYGGPTGHFGPWHQTILEAVPGQFPHLVKLVNNAPESEFEGGMYTIMTWHQEDEHFVLSAAVDSSQEYQVFATDGVLERVWYDSDTDGEFEMYDGYNDITANGLHDEMGLAWWDQYGDTIYTSRDFSCENAGTKGSDPVFSEGSSYLENNCLEKGDFLVIPAFTTGVESKNMTGDISYEYGMYPNAVYTSTLEHALDTVNSAGLYEIKKISVEDYNAYSNVTEDRFQIKLDRPIFWDGSDTSHNMIEDDEGNLLQESTKVGIRQFFRFTPDMDSANTAEWVAPCSNRGLCDLTQGLCTCFAGYTNENCDTQSALAV